MIYKSFLKQIGIIARCSKEAIRYAHIDSSNPHLIVVEFTVSLNFDKDDNIALKLASTKPSILIPLLKRIYFNESELIAIGKLYKLSVRKESRLINNQLFFKFMLPRSELTIFAFGITYKLWDLALSTIQSDSSFVRSNKIENFFYFSVFKSTKGNKEAQEIMKYIILEDGKYYNKLKRYLRSDLKRDLAPRGTACEFNLI